MATNPYCKGTARATVTEGPCASQSTNLIVGSKSVEYVSPAPCRKSLPESCLSPSLKRAYLMPRINKQRGVPSSLRMLSLTAMTVTGKHGENNPLTENNGVNWNQSSDRAIPHGGGVDIKYNSYARANARKTGATLRRSGYDINTPTIVGSNLKSGATERVCLPLCPVSNETF